MKSFRLYVPEAMPTPERVVSDYSEEEKAAFAETLKPLANRYRKRESLSNRFLFAFMASCFLVVFLGPYISKSGFMAIWAVSIVCWFAAASISPPLPTCPGCKNQAGEPLGEFCPACGSRSLVLDRSREYAACRPVAHRTRRVGKRGVRHIIHYCTYCGLHLDKDGL
jgi:hypothetical protein